MDGGATEEWRPLVRSPAKIQSGLTSLFTLCCCLAASGECQVGVQSGVRREKA